MNDSPNEPSLEPPSLTFEEYLDFLDEYWEIYGPVPEPEEKIEYKNIQI